MTSRLLPILAAMLWLPLCPCRADLVSPPPATAVIPLCGMPPILDGQLDDPCWSEAAEFTNFFDLDHQVFSTTALTAHAVYDRSWLYIGFRVRQDAAHRIQAPAAREHDGFVQRDDCVKLYFDPGTGGDCYYLFKVNQLNVRQERRIVNGNDEMGWNIPWRSAVAVTDEDWTVELAVPFSLLPPWEHLDRASFNLLHTRFDPENGKIVRKRWSLAPQYEALRGGIVDPALFVRARWAAGLDPDAPFLPYLVSAAAGPIRGGDDGQYYDLEANLRSYSGPGGSVVLRIEEQIADRTMVTSTNVAVPPNAESIPLRLAIPLTTLEQRKVVLALVSESSEVWQRIPVDTGRTFDFMSAFLEMNYYTDAKEARLFYSLYLDPDALAGKALEARMADGKVLSGSATLRPRGELALPIENLPPGSHTLELALKEAGAVMQTVPVTLVKRPPKPGMEWTIRRPDGTILQNGAPHLPFGIFVHQPYARPDTFRDVADIGFNSVGYWPYNLEPEQMDLALHQAAACGLTAFTYLEGTAQAAGTSLYALVFSGAELEAVNRRFASQTLTGLKCRLLATPPLSTLPESAKERLFQAYYETNRSRLLDGALRIMTVTNLSAYMHFDEPAPFQHPAMTDIYQYIHKQDGYHPIIACYDHPAVTQYADILAHRAYWVPATPGILGSVNHVTRTLSPIRRSATEKRMGLWFTLPIASAYLRRHQREFLPEEMRCQTYVAMIHGAKGLYYFCYPISHTDTRQTFFELANEWQILTPYLGAVEPEQEIIYVGGPYDLVVGPFPIVQCRLFRHADGAWLLLAANTSHDTPADTAFDLGELQPDGAIERLFGGPAPAFENSRLSDRIEPYGVRAYRFRATGPADAR